MTSSDLPRRGDATIAGLADRTTGLVGWTIAWRATSAVATLALGAFLIRQLPTDEYGRYTFVLSVLVYIALLATFGQDQGLLRYLPEVLGRGDRAAARDLLRKSAITIFAVWALTSAAVFALRPVIDSILHAHVGDLLALGTVLLLGSIATGKYVDVLLTNFRERLCFPVDFVGRGDMSRGGLLLRCAADRQELRYIAVAGAVVSGKRPPKLVPRRYPKG